MKSAYDQILGIEEDKTASAPQATPQPAGTQVQPSQQPQTAVAPKERTQTENAQTEAKKPTVDERMAEWKEANPEPVKRQVEAPETESTLSYKDILDRYAKAQQPDPREEKRRRINRSIAAVGDTIGALVNAVGTTAGGNSTNVDYSQGLSERMRKKYAEDDAAAKDLRDRWFALQMKAAALEDKDNDRKAQRYNAAAAKADTDYNTAKRNWDTAYDRQRRSYERQDEAAQKAQDREDTKEYRQKRLALDRQKADDTRSYHSRSLGIQQQRADAADGKKSGVKFRIGEWRSDRTFSKEELSTVAARMFEKGLIPVGDYNAAEMGLKNFAPLIEKAARTKEGERIMESNGFKKN